MQLSPSAPPAPLRWPDIWARVSTIEGATTEAELQRLCLAALEAPPGWIVELGCYKGRATCLLALAAGIRSVYRGETPVATVDPFQGYCETYHRGRDVVQEWSKPDSPEGIHAALAARGVAVAEIHKGTSEQAARAWDGTRRIGLLWVDGDHTAQGVRMDWELWSPFLAPGALVAWHDYHPPGYAQGRWDGVVTVVDELIHTGQLEGVDLVGCLRLTRWATLGGSGGHGG